MSNNARAILAYGYNLGSEESWNLIEAQPTETNEFGGLKTAWYDCNDDERDESVPEALIRVHPGRPMCSVDEFELRAPIRPASADLDFGLGLPGFAVTWTPGGGE